MIVLHYVIMCKYYLFCMEETRDTFFVKAGFYLLKLMLFMSLEQSLQVNVISNVSVQSLQDKVEVDCATESCILK